MEKKKKKKHRYEEFGGEEKVMQLARNFSG